MKNNLQFLLTNYINESKEKQFHFPTWNCMFFVYDWVKLISGIDYVSNYRNSFDNEFGAMRKLKELNNVDNCDDLLSIHFEQTRSISFAKLGDIVCVNPLKVEASEFFGLIPGLCYGSVSFFLSEQGLIKLNTLELEKSYVIHR